MTKQAIEVELRGAPRRILRDLNAGTIAPEYMVCGPAGTGKTFGILLLFHLLCCEVREVRFLFGRKTRESMTESVLPTFETILRMDGFDAIAANQKRNHRQAYEYPNGSRIVLGGFDKAEKILSTHYDGAYINEGLEISEEDHQTLSGRFDRPDAKLPSALFVLDCNPGDPNHWMKRRADEEAKSGSPRVVYLESKHVDNPALYTPDGELTEAGLRYMRRLDTLRGIYRNRFRDGIWTAGGAVWFDGFDPARDVTERAEYDPRLPVVLAIDPGVHTGAVFAQIVDAGPATEVRVFASYYAEGRSIEANASALREIASDRCGGRVDKVRIDPAASARTAFGVSMVEEWRRFGFPAVQPWPMRGVLEGLALVGSFLGAGLAIHPRCRDLISAFANYRRRRVRDQWVDEVEDPQHPYEDVMDPLRGVLIDRYPDGRRPDLRVRTVRAREVL